MPTLRFALASRVWPFAGLEDRKAGPTWPIARIGCRFLAYSSPTTWRRLHAHRFVYPSGQARSAAEATREAEAAGWDSFFINDTDLLHFHSAIAIARRSREHSNPPFGASLVGPAGQLLLEAENTVVNGPACTGYAETHLVQLESRFAPEFVAGCRLIASTELCPMCSGAIFWGGVGRVVFALGQHGLYGLVGPGGEELLLSCRDVFVKAYRAIEVYGPAPEDDPFEVHRAF